MRKTLAILAVSFLTGFGYAATEQTGTGCANGTDNCENNNLTTVNSTTTNNTNSNTNNNTNTNSNTNSNTNNNTNNTTTNSTSTATNSNTNSNTNVNTSTATSSSTNSNTNTNVNTSTATSNSTVNSTVTQAVTNTNNSTSSNTSTSNNTNVNESTSRSDVSTSNVNQNNTVASNTNRNINESNSTQTVNQNIKTEAPPASAIAPSIMSYSQDLCTTGVSGAFQGQLFGLSGGKAVRDMNCERLKLSKYLYDTGMKVGSVAILCQDERVFQAMFMAKTYCPVEGKISQEAYDLIVNKYNYEMPTYKKYVELEKKKIIKPKKKPKELHTR